MSRERRLLKQHEDTQARWDELSEDIRKLQKQYDRETRAEEQIRLEKIIGDKRTEREKIEVELALLEAEKKSMETEEWIKEAHNLESNKAYPEALDIWRRLRERNPNHPNTDREIARLEEKLEESALRDGLVKKLTHRFPGIKSIYAEVVGYLTQLEEAAVKDDPVITLVGFYLRDECTAQEFEQAWQNLKATLVEPRNAKIDFRVLAGRLQRGEIALFLGADMAIHRDSDKPFLPTAVSTLATKAEYKDFQGPLSKIAEYYEITERGRPSLIFDLENLIEQATPVTPLYELLAEGVEQPLVIISATYDGLLEKTFQRFGKRFMLIAPVIEVESEEFEVGNFFVHYSDKELSEPLRSEEELSNQEPLENGYSLIFKIRGCCVSEKPRSDRWKHTITLAEHNYFEFAHYKDKFIPNYLVKMLSGRGLLFLGFTPRDWEDRLTVNAILEKRYPQSEKPYVIGTALDRFEEAYWESKNVRRRSLDLPEFVRNLEAQFI